uniref:Large ribosomal subunit protein uL6 N-terminal domain-containing protein n=1 Tax=Otolemur garnettii TaxID=30611 RepID=H0XJA5_OTOGA
ARRPSWGISSHSRNPVLIRGIGRCFRSVRYSRKPKYTKKRPVAKSKIQKKRKSSRLLQSQWVGTDGGTRGVRLHKMSCYYPTKDVSRAVAPRQTPQWAPKKTSLTILITLPGTILIILPTYTLPHSRHPPQPQGQKQLGGGLLLLTGPLGLSRVALRRTHQKFVIATSTKIDIGNVKFLQLLLQQQPCKPRHREDEIFTTAKEKYEVTAQGGSKSCGLEILPKIKTITSRASLSVALTNGVHAHKLVL